GEPAFADRRELGPARDCGDLDPGARAFRGEPRRKMAADSAGAEDYDPHQPLRPGHVAMPNFRNPVQFLRRRQASLAAVLVCVAVLLASGPAGAFNMFGTRSVDVQFATQDGKPMADAEVRVYAPG